MMEFQEVFLVNWLLFEKVLFRRTFLLAMQAQFLNRLCWLGNLKQSHFNGVRGKTNSYANTNFFAEPLRKLFY